MVLYSIRQIFIFCIWIYLWTLFLIILLSLTLGILDKTLGIRKTLSRLFSKLFELISIKTELKRKEQQYTRNFESEDGEEQERDNENPQHDLIIREATRRICQKFNEIPTRSKVFTFADDSLDFIKAGMETIIYDEVTCRFSEKQLLNWNLLTRTSHGRQYVGLRYTILWFIGFLVRYCILLPVRLTLMLIGLTVLIVSTAVVGCLPSGKFKGWCYEKTMLLSFRILARAISIVATYHNSENMAKPGGICVANHTSPLDVQVLSTENTYAYVGQLQGGLLGLVERALSRASDHVWFERSETKDRQGVSKRLKEHVEDLNKRPVLIFPEGFCVNNTSIMMFKKGSFEVGGVIYPVAIKYDPSFGEAFWSTDSYIHYIITLMTSWGVVVEVWYLPPMTKNEDENAIQFASRVKHAIATVGGFVELDWDCELKRNPVKKEMVERQRKKWSERVQRAPNKSIDIGDEGKPSDTSE